ncbi:DUF2513 domain-containing protein [Oceanobacillus jeddahense]|uniref:DUF2513 domain-containing protein n=1 Tax=Oceanobacillus jeddahense TaxID=1462527 RepID=UPI000595FCA8|nr:DUF2513 domain-containing protein [Oceanobacillus jeddahense]
MKLNKDCVRNLLLYIEKQELGKHIYKSELENVFGKEFNYSPEEIEYATRKLKEANFIHANGSFENGSWIDYGISEITWDGHQFLDNIRDNKVWKIVKKSASKLSSISLTLMSKIAWSVIENHYIIDGSE